MKKAGKVLLRPVYGVMLMLSILRIYLGWVMGVWFPVGQLWDDALMMGYSDIAGHFLNPARYSLLKDMSFPIFLKASGVMHIPYSITLSLLWIMAALTIFLTFNRLIKSDWVSFFLFVYVLFIPQAFEFWCGTRLYRNAVIDPFVLITLSLMINMLTGVSDRRLKQIFIAVAAGLFLTFTYYIKEDGIWLLACLALTMVLAIGYRIYDYKKAGLNLTSLVKSIAIVSIPIIMFMAITLAYKAVNFRYFGVFEINTRTEGEYGKFVENIYKIESSGRSMTVWTPADAIEQAFEVSETLHNHPDLLNAVMTTEWQGGNIISNPIPGDHLNWILREEMNNVGLYSSEAWVADFFATVNDEIEAAFKDGRLKKQSGVVQIISSAGGYTPREIKSLKSVIIAGFKGAVLLDGYQMGLGIVDSVEIGSDIQTVEYAKGITGLSYLSDYTDFKIRSDRLAESISKLLGIYKIVNLVLFILTILIIVYEIICIIINIKTVKTFCQNRCKILLGVLGAFIFLGIAICYAAAISWFSAFLFADGIDMTILNFYNIALPGLLFIAYSFTVYSVREEIGFIITRKGTTKHD